MLNKSKSNDSDFKNTYYTAKLRLVQQYNVLLPLTVRTKDKKILHELCCNEYSAYLQSNLPH